MTLPALLLATAILSPLAQLDQHPGGQALYISVPEVQGMLQALENTPSSSFLQSEAMQPLLSMLPGEGWGKRDSVRSALTSALGMPSLEPRLAELEAISLSARAEQGGTALLAVLEFQSAQGAEEVQRLLAAAWGATADPLIAAQTGGSEPCGGLWRCRLESLPDLPIWLLAKGRSLALGGGLSSPEDFYSSNASALPLVTGKVESFSIQRAMEVLPGNAGAAELWIAHSEDPLALLRELDKRHALFQGLLTGLPALGICDPNGLARFGVSSSGYTLDCYVPGAAPSQGALDRTYIDQISREAMFVMACRQQPAALLVKLEQWSALLGAGSLLSQDASAKLERLLKLLDTNAIVYSNSVNSTSPPKSFLSIAIKPGEGQAQAVLKACSEAFGTLTGLPMAQREYRVRNRSTKESFDFQVHTLVMPEDKSRGLLTPSISPAFSVAEGRLLLSPRAMYLKNELRRLYDGKLSDSGELGPILARGLELPATANSLLLFDWADQIATLISFFPLLAMVIPDLPFQADVLPSPAELKQAFPPLFGYSQSDGLGTRHHYQSAVGLDALVIGLRLLLLLPEAARARLPF